MPNLLGTAPNQVPTNADLGKLAFMDVVDTVTNNPYVDTAISDTKPSLLLDFANSKTLDPRITYTRASTATYYDGRTTAKAEENLFAYSQEFDSWSKSNTTVTVNTTLAPDSTTTADTITASAVTGVSYIAASGNTTGAFVMSIYAKAGTHKYIQFVNPGDNQAYATFDLTAGAGVVGTTGSKTTASIIDAGSGWYRCIAVFDSTAIASTGKRIYWVASASSAYAPSITLAGTESVYLWGAQLEQRSSVSSYTPTTSSAITNYIPALQTAAAGVPRFDHDPVTGESKGFLIEEQRSNLLTYSEQFDNTAWNKVAGTAITANTIVAPDGSLSADKVYENTTSSTTFGFSQAFTSASGTTYTCAVYAKKAERYGIRLQLPAAQFGVSQSASFDLNSGTVLATTNNAAASITPAGNGWYRCAMTSIAATASVSGSLQIYLLDSSGLSTYAGVVNSGLYIWGAQLEAGSFATSYIPTTTAQVTRSADSASMTGSNFSSWYRDDEGTLYAEAAYPSVDQTFAMFASLNDGTVNNSMSLYKSSGTSQITSNCSTAGTAQWLLAPIVSSSVNTFIKVVNGYKTNDVAASGNGGAVVTDTTAVMPTVNQLSIGNRAGSLLLNNCIKRIAYYPKRLSDAELQEMTL